MPITHFAPEDRSYATGEAVLAELEHALGWGALDDERLARLAAQALFFIGRGYWRLEPLLGRFYPDYARRVRVAERARVFAQLRRLVHAGVVRPEVFLQFLRWDPEPDIVSAAAFETACFDLDTAAPGARGADCVLALVVNGVVPNSGAALGGLLAVGDQAITTKIGHLRTGFALPAADAQLAQMASYATGCVHATTIEFWLAWMETLARELPGSRRAFDWTAHALARQHEALEAPVIIVGRPAGREAAGGSGACRDVSRAEFAASIAPRLRALAAQGAASENFRRACDAWSAREGPDVAADAAAGYLLYSKGRLRQVA